MSEAFEKLGVALDDLDAELKQLDHSLDGLSRSWDGTVRSVVIWGVITGFLMLGILIVALRIAHP
jgi:hypothetical protein